MNSTSIDVTNTLNAVYDIIITIIFVLKKSFKRKFKRFPIYNTIVNILNYVNFKANLICIIISNNNQFKNYKNYKYYKT